MLIAFLVILLVIIVATGVLYSPLWAAALALLAFLTAFVIFVIFKVLKIWKNKPAIGEIVGKECEAFEDISKGMLGTVIFSGEIWNTIPDENVKKGDKLVIAGKDYWRLKVKKK